MRILSEDFSVPCIQHRQHDVFLGLQGRQGYRRRGFILKSHGCRAVISDDIRLRYQVLAQGMAKGNKIVNEEARGRQDYGDAARQHRDQHQFSLDGKILQIHSGFLPSAATCWTILASVSSLELMVRSACFAASTFTSKRILLSSSVKFMIPPRRAKPGPSPIVRMGSHFTASTTLSMCSFSDELTNRMLQSLRSLSPLAHFSRLTTKPRPLIFLSATILSRVVPKGSSPRMLITIGESDWANAVVGHSTNFAKL